MKNSSIALGIKQEEIEEEQNKISKMIRFIVSKFSSKKKTISIIRLSGVIGAKVGMKSGLTLENLNEVIEDAFKPKKLAAVCVIINSPGGSPVQSEFIASRIRMLAEEKNIPVYTFVEDIAASGGYWLATIGDEIYASKNSIIGSIGVISSGFGFKDAIEKLGIERRVYTAGKSKSILDPFSDEKKEDIEIIKKLQKQIHENFIEQVKKRRKGKLTQDDDILFNGEFWTGQTALDFGLIDDIGDLYSFINKNYKDSEIKYCNVKESWFKKKFGIIFGINKNNQDFVDSIIEKSTDAILSKTSDLLTSKLNGSIDTSI